MSILTTLNRVLGLTKAEGTVLMFLAAALLAGGGMKLFLDHSAPDHRFNYHTADSIFIERSKAPVLHAAMAASDEELATDDEDSSAAGSVSGAATAKAPARINLNTAHKSELMTLPGIGETMADRIIEYRKQHGRFQTPEDLLNIEGIGKKKLERLSPHITLQDR